MNVRAAVLFVLILIETSANAAEQTPPANASHFAPDLLIPVAGSVAGAYGTYFRTDLDLTNYGDKTATVGVNFFAGDDPWEFGDGLFGVVVSLAPHETITYPDVTANLLRSPGYVGSIVLTCIPVDCKLDATYRIWTPHPGGGTISQAGSAIDLATLPPGNETQIAMGVLLNADYRCNVGIFQTSFKTRSFRITASSESGSVSFVVAATHRTLTQVPVPPALLGHVTVTIEPLDVHADEKWAAYATSSDNRSGDSWLEVAAPR